MDDSGEVKRILKSIERIPYDRFVIHGSGVRKSTLLPRKPAPTTNYKLHHRKAIYGTRFVEIAIIYAVVDGDPKWRNVRGEGIFLFVPKEGLVLRDGYVYVCPHRNFTPHNFVCLSTRPVKPERVIKVPSTALEELCRAKRIFLWDEKPD